MVFLLIIEQVVLVILVIDENEDLVLLLLDQVIFKVEIDDLE
jgi:hypothetical protein